MSYDVSLHLDTGGPAPHCVHSQNLFGSAVRMLRRALPDHNGLNGLNGQKAGDIAAALIAAADHMDVHSHTYFAIAQEQHATGDAWQIYQDARFWLRQLAEACRDNPLCTIDVSR